MVPRRSHWNWEETKWFKELKASEIISEIDYKKLKPKGSCFGVQYGLSKTHKKALEKCPPFRPILSANKTPSCNLAKFLAHWTHNKN